MFSRHKQEHGDNSRFLIVKANATQLPLKSNSVSLVVATPPYIGAQLRRKGEYCTNSGNEYQALIGTFLAEAMRILKPYGHILITTARPPATRHHGYTEVLFRVLNKAAYRNDWRARKVRLERFSVEYVIFERMSWLALPVWVYEKLLERYSAPNDFVAHVFSGSGNGGIAALKIGRKPILVDLHYHRDAVTRITNFIRQNTRAAGGLPLTSDLDQVIKVPSKESTAMQQISTLTCPVCKAKLAVIKKSGPQSKKKSTKSKTK